MAVLKGHCWNMQGFKCLSPIAVIKIKVKTMYCDVEHILKGDKNDLEK